MAPVAVKSRVLIRSDTGDRTMADPRLPRGDQKASLEGLLMGFEEWVANHEARGEEDGRKRSARREAQQLSTRLSQFTTAESKAQIDRN